MRVISGNASKSRIKLARWSAPGLTTPKSLLLGKLGAHHFENGFSKRRVCDLLTSPGPLRPRKPPAHSVAFQVELLEPQSDNWQSLGSPGPAKTPVAVWLALSRGYPPGAALIRRAPGQGPPPAPNCQAHSVSAPALLIS
jgi:hypothetical protein